MKQVAQLIITTAANGHAVSVAGRKGTRCYMCEARPGIDEAALHQAALLKAMQLYEAEADADGSEAAPEAPPPVTLQ